MRKNAKRVNVVKGFTLPDVWRAVQIGMCQRNPANGMKLKPRDRRIGAARSYLEALVESANRGLVPEGLPF